MLEVSNLSERGSSWNEDTGGDDGWCEFDVTLRCDDCGKTVDTLFYKNTHSDTLCVDCFFNEFMKQCEGFEGGVDDDGRRFYKDKSDGEIYYMDDATELAYAADMRYTTEDYLDDDMVARAVERAREDEYDY